MGLRERRVEEGKGGTGRVKIRGKTGLWKEEVEIGRVG